MFVCAAQSVEAHSIQSAVQSAAASVKEHCGRMVRVEFLCILLALLNVAH